MNHQDTKTPRSEAERTYWLRLNVERVDGRDCVSDEAKTALELNCLSWSLGALVVRSVSILVLSCVWAYSQTSSGSDALSSAKASFKRGKQLLEERQFEQAATEFRKTLTATPNAPLVHNLLGFCQLQLGQTEQAVDQFKKAIALKPDYKAAHSNLGGIYLFQGRNQEAIAEFQAIVQSDPKDVQALSNLARAEMAASRNEAAIDHLRKAFELAPANLPISLTLARLYLEARQKEAGQTIVRSLRTARVDNNPGTQLELGTLLLEYEFDEDAQNRLRQALKADPKLEQALYAIARGYFKRQNYRCSLKSLECLSPAASNAADWHGMMGYCRFKLGDSTKAVNELQKAIDLDPQNQDHVLELAEVFVANNNAAAAVTLMETASQVFSQSSQIWFGLGVAYLGDEKRSQAEASLKRCLNLDPNLDLAYVVLGQGYKEAGNWNQLMETSERLIDVNPKNSAGYYYKALALQASPGFKSTDETEVEKLLVKSIGLNSGDPEPQYELAKLLGRQGKKAESLHALEKIVKSWPDFGPAYYQLSRIYRERGEMDKSRVAQQMHDRIRQKEHDVVMKRMIVEIQQRPRSGATANVQ
jgi:tetratricopeptide (TPR) repeat protein